MEKALDKMRRLCSRREYCVSDIRTKLMKELEGEAQKVEIALNIRIRNIIMRLSSISHPQED